MLSCKVYCILSEPLLKDSETTVATMLQYGKKNVVCVKMNLAIVLAGEE
jgi:hypothetical protein